METILITGANRGIGLELTRQFLAKGANVLATCRNPGQSSELLALRGAGALTILPLEVTDGESVAALKAELGDQPMDVLVNNAGIMGGEHQGLDDMDYSAWAEAFEVNTMAPFRLISTFRENLKRTKRPRAVTISSMMGALSRKSTGSHAYRSSKAAVNKVMQVLALELQEDGIVVCPVHPGWVRTDMGGSAADISTEESAAGLVQLITSMTKKHSGRFWTWEGKEHDW